MWYRAYLLGPRYSIASVAEFEATDDSVAVEHAAKIAEPGVYAGLELWQEARPVVLFPNRKPFRATWPVQGREPGPLRASDGA